MIRPYIPRQILKASSPLLCDIGWLGSMQEQVLNVVKDLVESFEVDSDTYSWWVLMLMRFPIANDNDDVKIIYQQEKDVGGPLSRYIMNICSKLSIPSSADIRSYSLMIARTLYRRLNNIDQQHVRLGDFQIPNEAVGNTGHPVGKAVEPLGAAGSVDVRLGFDNPPQDTAVSAGPGPGKRVPDVGLGGEREGVPSSSIDASLRNFVGGFTFD